MRTAGRILVRQADRRPCGPSSQEAPRSTRVVSAQEVVHAEALVVSEQLKAIGMNTELLVLDWPATVQKQQNKADPTGWNFHFTGYGTNTSLGGVAAMRFHAPPFNVYRPKGDVPDAEFAKFFNELTSGKTLDVRKAAFARAQTRVLDQVLALPFGTLTKVQAVRTNIENFRPFRIPRMSNLWLKS